MKEVMYCEHCGKLLIKKGYQEIFDGKDNNQSGKPVTHMEDKKSKCPDSRCRWFGKIAVACWVAFGIVALPCEVPVPFTGAYILIFCGFGSEPVFNFGALVFFSILLSIGLLGGIVFTVLYHRLARRGKPQAKWSSTNNAE